MSLLYKYIKSHRKALLLFLLFCIIFLCVFMLYDFPLASIGYGALLCVCIGLILTVPDYLSFANKHRTLQKLEKEVSYTIDHLPPTYSLLDEDYQKVIKELYFQKSEQNDRMGRAYDELVEYYTVWAHQIKTPIAAMRLLLQTSDSIDKEELSLELFKIEQYVEMVLCYLRVGSQTTDYYFKKYNLDTIVKQAVRKFAPQFIRKKISIDYKPLNCTVLTDEKWLLFVIEQVLSNALKYTKKGKISITLEENKTLCISDTGIGIASEDLPRIFEKGYTGYNGRNDKKASGIGLYLSKRILDRLGHRISVSSDIAKGTAVRICLDSTPLEVE